MAFCRKVNYSINVVLFEYAFNLCAVSDISLFKEVSFSAEFCFNLSKGFKVTRISQAVNVNNSAVKISIRKKPAVHGRHIKKIVNKVGTDKASPTGNKNVV